MVWVLAFLAIGPLGGVQYDIQTFDTETECLVEAVAMRRTYEEKGADVLVGCEFAWET